MLFNKVKHILNNPNIDDGMFIANVEAFKLF
jgi:hypothetical protein